MVQGYVCDRSLKLGRVKVVIRILALKTEDLDDTRRRNRAQKLKEESESEGQLRSWISVSVNYVQQMGPL